MQLPAGRRFGMSYDLTGSGRTAIKGSFGGFIDDIAEFFLQRFGPLALITTTYRWHDNNNDKLYQPGEVDLSANSTDFLSASGGNVSPSTFQIPYSYEATAGIE